MKKLTLLLISILFITGNLYAQKNVGFTFGIRPVSYSGSSIQLFYRDESPAPDNFYTDIDLSETTLYNLGFSLNKFTPEKYYLAINLDLYFGSYFAGELGLSAGMPFYIRGNRRIRFLPHITGGIGMYRKKLGQLENNTTWIKVNDIQFNDYENVSLSLSGLFGYIKPTFQVMYKVKHDVEVFLSTGYSITFEGTPDVDFGGNSGDESVVATEELGARNIAFYVDGQRTDDSPFNLSGFEI